jgi:hypothetical protein
VIRLLVDPWRPDYGVSTEFQFLDDLPPAVGLELDVETAGRWEPISPSQGVRRPCCAFIDGVLRIEARLFAEETDAIAPGLAGSWAVGCAWSTRPPKVTSIVVGRELVIGGGLVAPEPLEVNFGGRPLVFWPRSVHGSAPRDPVQGLQNAMREAEGELAQQTLASGAADLVVSDGPLSYFSPGPAMGMVKRQSRSYLDASRVSVLGRLEAGERTPLFKLGEQRLERYSWYLRLAKARPIDGTMAGLVRMEVAASHGLDAARALADLAGAALPQFASQPGRDPRAPQNVYPIGALESALRRRLGDTTLIRRNFETHLLVRSQT